MKKSLQDLEGTIQGEKRAVDPHDLFGELLRVTGKNLMRKLVRMKCDISSRCLQFKEKCSQLFIRRHVVDSRMRFDSIIEIDESGKTEFPVLP